MGLFVAYLRLRRRRELRVSAGGQRRSARRDRLFLVGGFRQLSRWDNHNAHRLARVARTVSRSRPRKPVTSHVLDGWTVRSDLHRKFNSVAAETRCGYRDRAHRCRPDDRLACIRSFRIVCSPGAPDQCSQNCRRANNPGSRLRYAFGRSAPSSQTKSPL